MSSIAVGTPEIRHQIVTSVQAQRVSRARVLKAAILLGLGVFAVQALFVPGALDGSDGWSMLQVTASIVNHDDVSVSHSVGVPGLHGQYYSKYGPAQSLLSLPLYQFGRLLGPLVPAYYRPELPVMASSFLPALAIALTVVLLVLGASELGASLLGALGLGLVYAFATPAYSYAGQWFSEPLTACLLLASVYLLLRDRTEATLWRPLVAGTVLATAVATRIESLLYMPPLFLYALLPQSRRVSRALAFAAPLAVVLAGLGVYNEVRFGKLAETGYDQSNNPFDYRDAHPPHTLASFAEGVYGLMLSPGKGLVEYAPAVLLAPLGAIVLWARRRADTLLLLSLIAICLVAHANILIRWLGGWSWGPRFMLTVLPLVLLLLAPLLAPAYRWRTFARRALVVLAIIGALVQIPAVVVHEPHTYIASIEPRYRQMFPHNGMKLTTLMEQDYSFKPDLSPIIGSWQMLWRPGTWSKPACLKPAAIAAGSCSPTPRAWWAVLAAEAVPVPWLLLCCALLLIVATVALQRAWRLAGNE